ncbi:hypothetical protein EVAR_66313_1 [Eumeta japonica]|uniref:Uncharacterized protein n=1 Tax=Eumeta variegata TaxID=151549 RepID=A0A4C1ZTY2_EUMVA|nr:hypothetical protein EVAR_66313_1 [Eumeta japonica]
MAAIIGNSRTEPIYGDSIGVEGGEEGAGAGGGAGLHRYTVRFRRVTRALALGRLVAVPELPNDPLSGMRVRLRIVVAITRLCTILNLTEAVSRDGPRREVVRENSKNIPAPSIDSRHTRRDHKAELFKPAVFCHRLIKRGDRPRPNRRPLEGGRAAKGPHGN